MHELEILVDCLVFGAAIVYLLGRRKRAELGKIACDALEKISAGYCISLLAR